MGYSEQRAAAAPRNAVAGADATASPGTLYIVATPIGNLGDVTLRSVEVLRGVPLVAAEDTRVARKLFARHGIATRLISFHARNAAQRTPELVAHLAGGSDLALITDAGTPGVSDPGAELAAAWAERGGAVVAIPGASAVLAALVASGFVAPRWSFEGFLPRGGRERSRRLERIGADERATVLFESAARTAATLADLARACGSERPAALARELTKMHEEVWRGTLGALATRAAETVPRGEVTIVVGPSDVLPARRGRAAGRATMGLVEARKLFDDLVRAGASRSAAARSVSAATGLDRREIYRRGGSKRPAR